MLLNASGWGLQDKTDTLNLSDVGSLVKSLWQDVGNMSLEHLKRETQVYSKFMLVSTVDSKFWPSRESHILFAEVIHEEAEILKQGPVPKVADHVIWVQSRHPSDKASPSAEGSRKCKTPGVPQIRSLG